MYIVIDNICILLYIIYRYNIVIYILILCNNVCNIIGGYNIYIIYNMGKYKSREWYSMYTYICIHNVYGVHIIDTSISEYMVIYVGMYICVCDSNVV